VVRIHVVEMVKLFVPKAHRSHLEAAVQKLVNIGIQRYFLGCL
jgi:hypothetical protein